jgi:SpoVK/Ycf46/Vps4 family AAA+-type ATPase
MSLDMPIKAWSAVQGVYDGLLSDSPPIAETENPAAALMVMAREERPTLYVLLDVAGYLGADDRTLRAWRELLQRCVHTRGCVVLVDHREQAPAIVDTLSVQVEIPLPDEEDLERVIRETFRRLHKERGVQAAVSRDDLQAFVVNLRGLTKRQAEQLITEAILNDMKLTIEDLPTILEGKRKMVQSEGILEHVSAPETMDQIGGMERLKAWLKKREDALTGNGAEPGMSPPRGILLLGVQGAGKSLCAKAVAAAWKRPLLRMDVGRLYDKYVGESERRLRSAFTQAETMAPIVLWIDEIEKAFASAASQSTDGGLSRRMFGALLTWMQEHRAPVFLVATANDIEALPPELLRKGRFDEIFFVDLPGSAAREQILRIHLKKRGCDPGAFDVPALVKASQGFSGAEIEQGVIAGMHDARAERRALTGADVLAAMKTSPPLSVTMAERMGALREWAKGRCVPAE